MKITKAFLDINYLQVGQIILTLLAVAALIFVIDDSSPLRCEIAVSPILFIVVTAFVFEFSKLPVIPSAF